MLNELELAEDAWDDKNLSTSIFEKYTEWCEMNKEKSPGSKKYFDGALKDNGYEKVRRTTADRGYYIVRRMFAQDVI